VCLIKQLLWRMMSDGRFKNECVDGCINTSIGSGQYELRSIVK
jgi:hypothetical protein